MPDPVFQGPGVDSGLVQQLKSWGIKSLTQIQERALQAGVAEGRSMIICAPTSSGKTLVGEIAVLCALRSAKKSLYLVSHKALADQKFNDFKKKFGEESSNPIVSVGLSTGDRDEGDHDPQLLVATYEKALGLLLSGDIDPKLSLVVADELQILGDPNRGPNIEALCALLRQRGVSQFLALTATVENPHDLANWLGCETTVSNRRDIALHQEIWYKGKGHTIIFGNSEGQDIAAKAPLPDSTLEAVSFLLKASRGPVLVFTETRREALDYAKTYSQKCTRAADGIALAEQLELFSEPTEASDQLKESAERKVAFHTADLTAPERQVIEQGFIDSKFEVCFATSTLAAGVNFPFRSVLFPKLTYKYTGRAGTLISRGDYRNMSGRAGRLGMHDRGFAILLPANGIELTHANKLVLPENDRVESQLVRLSMRRTVLMLISSGIIDQEKAVRGFFEQTLYWHQIRESTPAKLDTVLKVTAEAIRWLIETKMVENNQDQLMATPLGKATAQSGLLPSTAANFVKLLATHQKDLLEHFDQYLAGFIYWTCSCDEFDSETPTRFLSFPTSKSSSNSMAYLSGQKLFQPLDRTNEQLAQCAHALVLYLEGTDERKVAYNTKVSSGNLHRLAIDISWVLDGLHRIASVPDLKCPQQLSNRMSMLSRRVRWGAPAEVLDIIRVAERHGVPGFGRQRAMALLAQGLATFEDILISAKEKLVGILRSEPRTASLLAALHNAVGTSKSRLAKTHAIVAKELGIEGIVADCDTKLGNEYEAAVMELLKVESSWSLTVVDSHKRQNVPDLLIKLNDIEIFLECKTCTKKPPLITKDEAFAVLQKATDFDSRIRRVTLGKPGFDEHSKMKAQASPEITLVEHSIFMEGILRVHTGKTTPIDFLKWLGTPGVTELDRLSGKATYLK